MIGDRIIHWTDSSKKLNNFFFFVLWPRIVYSNYFKQVVFRCESVWSILISNQSNINFEPLGIHVLFLLLKHLLINYKQNIFDYILPFKISLKKTIFSNIDQSRRRINNIFFEGSIGICRTILLANCPDCCLSKCSRNLPPFALSKISAITPRLQFILWWNIPCFPCDCYTSFSQGLILHPSPLGLHENLCRKADEIRKIHGSSVTQ